MEPLEKSVPQKRKASEIDADNRDQSTIESFKNIYTFYKKQCGNFQLSTDETNKLTMEEYTFSKHLLDFFENFNTIQKTTSQDQQIEPLEDPQYARYTINPISKDHLILYELYEKQAGCYWTKDEITYDRDKDDFNSLDENEKHFIKYILAFFAGSDGIVNFNISSKLLKRITNVEARLNYGFQFNMENTHGIVYSKLLENIVKDGKEYEYLLKAIETIPTIKKMADWALKWTNGDYPLGQLIIGYAIVEGIFFSGAFAAIYWLKKGKKELFMRGLVKANEFIARDEGMHTNFAVLLYKYIVNRVSEKTVHEMVSEGVLINQEFLCDSISCKMIGMDKNAMSRYIEYVADRLLTYLGYKKIYNVTNPFEFMETIGLNNRTNFFENRPTDYQKAHTTSNNADWQFSIADEF